MDEKEKLIFKKALVNMILHKEMTLFEAIHKAIYQVLSSDDIKCITSAFDIDVTQYVHSLEQVLINFVTN